MAITKDWHIHTHCSCDSACMTFEDLVSEAKELGIPTDTPDQIAKMKSLWGD